MNRTVNYAITLRTPKLLYFFSFSSNIRMSGKNVKFGNKKIKKVTFTKTKK